MARYERVIVETITHLDLHTDDPRPGRERYFAHRKGSGEWLRVVVDFNDNPGWVVTAFGHDQEPT
jgi:hypothetical protein